MSVSPYNGVFGNGLDNESAYWLGFIWADGSIGKYGRAHQFDVGLQSSDRDHLEKLVTFLGYPLDRINERDGASHFQGRSVDLFNDLWELGVRPNKSESIDEIYCESDYMHHFLRGLFDGDGSIGVYERKGGRSDRPRFSYYGRETAVDLVKREIEAGADVELSDIDEKNTGVFAVTTGGRKNMKPIFDLFYSDGGPWLNRKYEIFKQASELEPAPDPGYENYDENGRALVKIECNLCEKTCWKRADQVMRSEKNYCSRSCAGKVNLGVVD